MNDGDITNNRSGSQGGGVGTYDDWFSTLNPSNTSGHDGLKVPYSYGDGDSYLENWDKRFPAEFIMNGGVIQGNSTGSTGGGIYIGSATNQINGGSILNNYAGSQGGGIYVSMVPYTITIKNVTIHDNSASLLGGGLWFCPTGEAEIVVNNGALIYGNTASGAGDDFVSTAQTFMFTWMGQPTTLADHMLGGGASNWYQDGGVRVVYAYYETLGGSPNSTPRYGTEGVEDVAVSSVVKNTSVMALKALPTEDGIAAGEEIAKVFIIGNRSYRGGGIGSNGTVILGDVYKNTKSVTALKQWVLPTDQEVTQPEAITIYLVNESTGERVHEAVLNAENDWTYTWADLARDIIYTIEEEVPEGWEATYTALVDADNNLYITITNAIPQEPEEPNEPEEPIIIEEDVPETPHPNAPPVVEEPETTVEVEQPTPAAPPVDEPPAPPAKKTPAKKVVKKAALTPIVKSSVVAQTGDEAPIAGLVVLMLLAGATLRVATRRG